MDEFTTIEELAKWASQHGLMEDDLVNLRRVKLMAENMTQQGRNSSHNVCTTCSCQLKDKKSLFTQEINDIIVRRAGPRSTELICFRNTLNFIRERDDMMTKTTTPSLPRNPGQVRQQVGLLSNTKVVVTLELIRTNPVRKWLPERFYSLRTDICDRCIHRRDNWKTRQQQGGGNVSNALEGTVQTEIIEQNPGTSGITAFFVDN